MIMVGPGTGIAPFRGFLQERRALGHTGPNWLFFGDRHRGENYYYRDDLEDMVRDGFLNRLELAFSRDQADGSTCSTSCSTMAPTCGAGSRTALTSTCAAMPPGWPRTSTTALTTIIRTHGGMSDERPTNTKRSSWHPNATSDDVY